MSDTATEFDLAHPMRCERCGSLDVTTCRHDPGLPPRARKSPRDPDYRDWQRRQGISATPGSEEAR